MDKRKVMLGICIFIFILFTSDAIQLNINVEALKSVLINISLGIISNLMTK